MLVQVRWCYYYKIGPVLFIIFQKDCSVVKHSIVWYTRVYWLDKCLSEIWKRWMFSSVLMLNGSFFIIMLLIVRFRWCHYLQYVCTWSSILRGGITAGPSYYCRHCVLPDTVLYRALACPSQLLTLLSTANVQLLLCGAVAEKSYIVNGDGTWGTPC